mgnify:FL=1
MGIKKFGVLYLDGKIVQPGTSCSDLVSGQKTVERIVAFGDSQSEESNIVWVQADNLWVAINSYLLNISYKELEDTGLALGRVVRIDGVPYQCRSLNLVPYYTADGQVRDEGVACGGAHEGCADGGGVGDDDCHAQQTGGVLAQLGDGRGDEADDDERHTEGDELAHDIL